MRSTSSMLKELLLADGKAAPRTGDELYEALREAYPGEAPTRGGVSGFMAKAQAAGAVTATNVGGIYHYTMTDKKALGAMAVREGRGPGSKAGRSRTYTPKLPSLQSVQERLLELAAELESARTPLSAYSSEELLAELTRRTKEPRA